MFIWDERKRKQVIREHAVDFEKIKDVFEDAFSIDFIDDEHSTETEIRHGVIGKTAAYGLITATYTVVDETIRLITARRAENWIAREYEKRRKRF